MASETFEEGVWREDVMLAQVACIVAGSAAVAAGVQLHHAISCLGALVRVPAPQPMVQQHHKAPDSCPC